MSSFRADSSRALDKSAITWAPINGMIRLRDDREIDVSGSRWVIPTPSKTHVIDWGQLNVPAGDHLNAIRRWIAHLLRTQSPTVGAAGFRQAAALFASAAFLAAAERQEAVPYLAFSQAQNALGLERRWQLHYARHFYRWCRDQRFPYFVAEVVTKLDDLVIGGNRKGEAVRSANPDQGPLDAREVSSLALALRAVRMENSMPLEEQAALWLGLAFGANSLSMR